MKITAIGMYHFDNTLFDRLTFPEGIEKDLALNTILMKSGEFELLYPDATFFKMQIEFWGKKHYATFEKWMKALEAEYNPIYNYDRHEEYSDHHTSTTANHEEINNESNAATNTTGNRSVNVDDESKILSDIAEKSVSAYDSSGYVPSEKDTRSSINTQDTNTTDQSETESSTNGTSNTTTTGGTDLDENVQHDAHLYGNIGVTTTMQMIREELELRRFNIYEQIADIFVDEFCIQIY